MEPAIQDVLHGPVLLQSGEGPADHRHVVHREEEPRERRHALEAAPTIVIIGVDGDHCP
jgi:hypothetical protein